ncbi:TIGR03086 family protein [Rhizocola hellebori]|uniref:TIGR03086 family protein n=1 Tax=Rhizocola hellebori TaxID=1392758 RepID=A0A8J3Q9C9_9ACTN|nr:TIGR03086 family metal-binding protein [Rhizocola hellebori]GIH05603.1 TIGR03086 family protein [Rhizocola hellebori]
MIEQHCLAMRHSVKLVELIHDDQWGLPTPCAQWDLRQLVEHMILENRGFAAAARGETEDKTAWTERSFGDLRSDYAESAQRVMAAFGEPEVLQGEFWLPLIAPDRRFPARQAISFHLLDYVVHGWDVAATLRQPVDYPDDLVELVREIADREVPDGPRRLRPGASFQPAIAWQEGDSALDGLLAVLGRSPRWPN